MFITHGGRHFNLASPIAAETIDGHGGARALKFRNAVGHEIGTCGGAQDIDLERLTAPVVPAAVPTLAVVARVEPTDRRPTPDDVRVITTAVVAWRVTRNGGEPVFVGPEPAGALFLGLPGGKLLEVATGRLHGGVDEAKQSILATAQREWDHDHPVEAVVEIEQPKVAAGGRRRGG